MVAVAVLNQKGGVGKTTISLGLAAAATARGMSTLVVDLDPQANATTGLGVFDDDLPTIADVLDPDSPESLDRVLIASGWPTDRGGVPALIPGSAELAVLETLLGDSAAGTGDAVAALLGGVDHDLVVIDCPPSVGLLTINALFAADRVVVVAEPSAWSHDAVAQALGTVAHVSARRRGAPSVAAVVVNRLGRTRDNRYWAERIAEAVDPTPTLRVHHRAALPEAAARALPVDALGKRSGAAEAAAEIGAVLDAVLGGPGVPGSVGSEGGPP